MPIYEYICNNCNNQFELLQKVSDEPATDCPNCNEPEVRKMVSATSFRLKSGWYETDFKDKPKNAEKSKTTTVVGTNSSETKKVERKTELKPKKTASTTESK